MEYWFHKEDIRRNPYAGFRFVDKRGKSTVYFLSEKKEIKQQLDFLYNVETYIEQVYTQIKQENSVSYNCVFFNKKHISKKESIQTNGIEKPENTNSSFESFINYHELTRIFCALVGCSAYAMFLKNEVSAVSKKSYEMLPEKNKQMLDDLQIIMEVNAELKKVRRNRNKNTSA